MASFQDIFSSVWSIAVAIFFLGASIFVHELGHFLAARWRGMKVERFSIGFGPKIFGWFGRDGVEYRVAWFPFGGYVMLPQMANLGAIEGEAKTDVSKLPPVSYRSKVITLSAGAFFNILFAIVLSIVIWAIGQQVAVEEQSNVISSVLATVKTSDGKTVQSPAAAAGIKPGDSVLAVDGDSVATFSDIYQGVILGSGRDKDNNPRVTLTIKRGEEKPFDVDVTPVYVDRGRDQFRDIGISLAGKIVIAAVTADSAAAAAGLKTGDIFTHIDGDPIQTTATVAEHIARTKGKQVIISYVRDGVAGTVTLTPRLTTNPDTQASAYLLGVVLTPSLTFVTSHVAPWAQVIKVVTDRWKTYVSLVSPHSDIGLNKMSGPVGIVTAISNIAKFDFMDVLVFVVLINVSLAIFNMLPIPVLDGGHIMFATIEKLRGRPLPPRFIMTTQSVFMLLLIMMMIYVTFFDVRRIIPQSKPVPTSAAQQAPAAQQQQQTTPAPVK